MTSGVYLDPFPNTLQSVIRSGVHCQQHRISPLIDTSHYVTRRRDTIPDLDLALRNGRTYISVSELHSTRRPMNFRKDIIRESTEEAWLSSPAVPDYKCFHNEVNLLRRDLVSLREEKEVDRVRFMCIECDQTRIMMGIALGNFPCRK